MIEQFRFYINFSQSIIFYYKINSKRLFFFRSFFLKFSEVFTFLKILIITNCNFENSHKSQITINIFDHLFGKFIRNFHQPFSFFSLPSHNINIFYFILFFLILFSFWWNIPATPCSPCSTLVINFKVWFFFFVSEKSSINHFLIARNISENSIA